MECIDILVMFDWNAIILFCPVVNILKGAEKIFKQFYKIHFAVGSILPRIQYTHCEMDSIYDILYFSCVVFNVSLCR